MVCDVLLPGTRDGVLATMCCWPTLCFFVQSLCCAPCCAVLCCAVLQVVVTEATRAAVAAAEAGGRSCWRVSSTLFSHIASDVTLQPLQPFAAASAAAAAAGEEELYPAVKAGVQVRGSPGHGHMLRAHGGRGCYCSAASPVGSIKKGCLCCIQKRLHK
jgi:hypothetical protein